MNMNKDKTIEKGAGFSQGPWTSDWVGTKPNGSAVVWLGENTNKRIAVIGTGRDEANARLIAQAPAMLEALKNVERALKMPISLEAIRLLVIETIHKAELEVDGGEEA